MNKILIFLVVIFVIIGSVWLVSADNLRLGMDNLSMRSVAGGTTAISGDRRVTIGGDVRVTIGADTRVIP